MALPPSSSTSAQRFARNALWLIALNLFLRTVGVSFNVYLAGRAGGEVMGLYSLITGVYGFFVTLGSGGAHLGCTRLVADTLGQFPEGTLPPRPVGRHSPAPCVPPSCTRWSAGCARRHSFSPPHRGSGAPGWGMPAPSPPCGYWHSACPSCRYRDVCPGTSPECAAWHCPASAGCCPSCCD